MSYYTAAEQAAMDRDGRNMKNAGVALSTELENIQTLLGTGANGITADSADVDSLALGGGHGTEDTDTGPHTGLVFAWKAFRFHNGLATVTVAAGTLTLTASQTNYVEVDRAGTVSANTSAFTSGKLPMWTVTCGTSTITTVTSAKCLLTLIGTAGTVGSMLSTAGATKSMELRLGNITGNSTFQLMLPSAAGTISGMKLTVSGNISESDSDYWTFGVINKGAAGNGTAVVVSSAAAVNSTKDTGGSGLTAYVARGLTLGDSGNLTHAANDVLALTFTNAASAGNLTDVVVRVDSIFTA